MEISFGLGRYVNFMNKSDKKWSNSGPDAQEVRKHHDLEDAVRLSSWRFGDVEAMEPANLSRLWI